MQDKDPVELAEIERDLEESGIKESVLIPMRTTNTIFGCKKLT